jgi:hypothetical protein
MRVTCECGHSEDETYEFDMPIAKAQPFEDRVPGKCPDCGGPVRIYLCRTQEMHSKVCSSARRRDVLVQLTLESVQFDQKPVRLFRYSTIVWDSYRLPVSVSPSRTFCRGDRRARCDTMRLQSARNGSSPL